MYDQYEGTPRKPVLGVSDKVRHIRAVQTKKMDRGLKFQVIEEEGLGIYMAKTKVLICTIVFSSAKSRFSHDAAHKTL